MVAIDDYIATVKISNQKYDGRHEDCLPVGTEFAKLKANWAEVNEKEEELQPTIVMTRLASKQRTQNTERGEAGQSTASAPTNLESSVSSYGQGSSVSTPMLGSSVSTPGLESSVSTPRLEFSASVPHVEGETTDRIPIANVEVENIDPNEATEHA